MKSTRIGLAAAVIGLVGLVGLAGCGRLAESAQLPADTSPEAVALASMGFDTAGLDPAVAPSDHPVKGRRGLRVELRKNVLHGETVVQTKNGTQTIEVQRGQVTAVTASSVTIKSTDGFTETWTFGEKFTVVQKRAKVAASAIKSGAQIGIAGTKSGDTSTARLAVLP
jgi:ABC-type transport system substrate-binding protein